MVMPSTHRKTRYGSLLLAAAMAWPLAAQAANKLPKLKPFADFIGTTSKGERIDRKSVV